MWNDFAYGRNAVYPEGHHGNAVLSRFPIVQIDNRDISVEGHEKHGMLHCQMTVPGESVRVHVICVHPGLHEEHRQVAHRGVSIEVLPDGYGSPNLSDEFVSQLTSAGVTFRYYYPRPLIFGMRTNLFRRMHRNIVVVDGQLAFVGGINYSAEHMIDYGTEAKQNYAVKVKGPVLLMIFTGTSYPPYQVTITPDAGGSGATIALMKTLRQEKLRRCLSGGTTISIAMILNAII